MYILASFLVVGFICNALIRPVTEKWLMSHEDLAALREATKAEAGPAASGGIGLGGGFDVTTILAWAAVCIPLAWGVWKTLEGAIKIFQ